MLYALTIFVSAFLLFLVQPLIAKQILPWFGGTAAVWTVCLVFFQLVLLAGYSYADALSRQAPRRQAVVHTVLVAAACLMLPIIPDVGWKPVGDADPTVQILLLLAATIGLPYLAVCATGPLVQSWFARVHAKGPGQARVYRLFALSNMASLVALVAYPFALEPYFSLRVQSWGWSAGFTTFAVLVIASAWRTERHLRQASSPMSGLPAQDAAMSPQPTVSVARDEPPHLLAAGLPRPGDYAMWLALAALGTVMLLAVTTHITQDVASVPFLWILPLALYLLTFILCFDSSFWYRRWLFWPAVIVLAPLMAWGLSAHNGVLPLYQAIPLFCSGLFVVCMFCHGELVRAKPVPAWLTRFYLMISLGGALGGLFVGVLAPRIFNAHWELPIALVASCLLLWWVARAATWIGLTTFSVGLLAALLWFAAKFTELPASRVLAGALVLGCIIAAWVAWRGRSVRAGAGFLAGMAAVCCVYMSWIYGEFILRNVVRAERNFYGVLRVLEYGKESGKDNGKDGGEAHSRLLMHGVISHGHQFMAPDLNRRLTSYYGETSGAGLAIAKVRSPRQRIGVVGLGVGTLAGYGSAGGTLRYYEINPVVVGLADTYFSYLKDSASTVETVLGDARLTLEKEAATTGSQQFDVLVIDAFSSDSIPVHLMTREALAVYRKHIRPGGVIAFHTSNRFLNLVPVVTQLALDAGMQSVHIDDRPSAELAWQHTTDYVLVTDNQVFLADPEVVARAVSVKPVPGLQVWTDDYNNLLKILRRP